MCFGTFLQNIRSTPNVPKFYARVPDDHVLDGELRATEFEAGQAYFELRLLELHLKNRREFLSGYLPFAVSVVEFLYDDRREKVPFFVGNELLRCVEETGRRQPVEFFNTKLAGPIPYMGDDVALFVGLYRARVEDLSEKLFGLLHGAPSAPSTWRRSRPTSSSRNP
jgi:hypothetical protein